MLIKLPEFPVRQTFLRFGFSFAHKNWFWLKLIFISRNSVCILYFGDSPHTKPPWILVSRLVSAICGAPDDFFCKLTAEPSLILILQHCKTPTAQFRSIPL